LEDRREPMRDGVLLDGACLQLHAASGWTIWLTQHGNDGKAGPVDRRQGNLRKFRRAGKRYAKGGRHGWETENEGKRATRQRSALA
ncbi:hypothetical protein NQ026_14520, partial [Staphylococcus aureus]|nr:hypothetical protein [Staphylococcus aureus]